MDAITNRELDEAWQCVSPQVRRTPILTSRLLDEETGFRVALKAEMFQRTGAYKIRGALNKLRVLSPQQKQRGVICSSAGNHAQGVALAAALAGVRAVVVMAENATPSKIAATRAYGAEVILHGTIWDEANEEALRIVAEQGLTYVHPFDDRDLIAGQATVGLEIVDQLPDVEVVVVPIGGGGLISGVAQAVKRRSPRTRVVGVESSGAPGMRESVRAGRVVTLDAVDCVIDGLRVRRVGELGRVADEPPEAGGGGRGGGDGRGPAQRVGQGSAWCSRCVCAERWEPQPRSACWTALELKGPRARASG